ncbi:hypothetical protein [Pontibacillus litoralis]|uniref:Uncharacterized protein n=1 Tax=Pontibacillus litoralis JSM 072002 TaxID=1385512 RepID=A0A0A5G3M3_9BACI|nr:hypothetical protein [Pontibacillus litoralis]KGX86634.1 hypothetical protein N784_04125 [Pontibacillus litoralis JSM 072002]
MDIVESFNGRIGGREREGGKNGHDVTKRTFSSWLSNQRDRRPNH